MKIKAIIIGEDRQNDVVVLSRRKLKGAKSFKFGDCTYFLQADRFLLTHVKRWFGLKKEHFATFYYKQGIAKPLPFPDFPEVTKEDFEVCKCPDIAHGAEHLEKCEAPQFKGVIDLGMPGGELAAAFNEWFYRTIAPAGLNKFEQLLLLVTLGVGVVALYLLYVVIGLQGDLETLVQAAEAAGGQVVQQGTSQPIGTGGEVTRTVVGG